jgi:hypothetical protein
MKNFNKLYAVALSVFFSLMSIPLANAAVPAFSNNTDCTFNPIVYTGSHNSTLLVTPPVVYCSSGTYYMLRVSPTSYSNTFAQYDFTVKLYHSNQLIVSKTYPKLSYDVVINTNNSNPMTYVDGIEISYNGIIVATRGTVPSCFITDTCDLQEIPNVVDPGCDLLDFSQSCDSPPVGTFDSCNDFNILSPTSWVKCLFIPSPGQIDSLLTSFHNNLTTSFVGDGIEIINFIISPIVSWKDLPVQCEGYLVDLTFGDTQGSFLPSDYLGKIPHYIGNPFSTCNNESMQYVSGWILNIQKFIFTFGGILLTSHILFTAFGMSVSVFTFWRKTK